MASDKRPSARNKGSETYGPPAEVRKAVVRRNPAAKPVQLPPEPAVRMVRAPEPAPTATATAGDGLDLTQQDAVDLVFSLTEGIESANAGVQRWAGRGDSHRADAALMQARRLEALRDRIAGSIARLSRRG